MSLLMLFYFIPSIFGLEKFLQFTPHKDVRERRTSYQFNKFSINYDAYLDSQVLIKYLLHYTYASNNVTFYCHVKPLDKNYKITKAYFCKKSSLTTQEDCYEIYKKTHEISFGFHFNFSIIFDSTEGMIIRLSIRGYHTFRRARPFHGFYYCKLYNILGSISSNYAEIQDHEFYRLRWTLLFDYRLSFYNDIYRMAHFTSESFPFYILCCNAILNYEKNVPKWLNYDLFSQQLEWRFCRPFNRRKRCLMNGEANYTFLEDFFHCYQFPNGSIVLMGLKRTDYRESGLLCSIDTSDDPQYLSEYFFKNETRWQYIYYYALNSYRRKIKFLTETDFNITTREGIYDNKTRFKLYALYVSNPDPKTIAYEWRKDNARLPSTFIGTSHELLFPIEIYDSDSGLYELTVSQSKPPDNATFRYKVTISCPPKLKDRSTRPSVIYSLEYFFPRLSLSFDRDITNLSLEINNIPIDVLSETNKENDLKRLFLKYEFLTGIDISANISVSQGLIEYEVKNLTKNLNTSEGKTHIVTFIAENPTGVSKISYLIRILESPKFIHYLKDFSCINNCSNQDKHIFKCAIEELEYKKIGFLTKYVWSLNGLSLNYVKGHEQMIYLDINRDTITLKPFKSENPIRDQRMTRLFSNSILSCKVIISFNNKDIQYNSDDHPNVKSLLEAKIKLQENQINVSLTSWMIPLILSFIVMVAVVTLTLYFCQKFSGKTYNVDQNGSTSANDPEIECIDNVIYQPHRKNLETNVRGQTYLSCNTYDNISDKEELNAYELDSALLNEDRFISFQNAIDGGRFKIINL